MNSFKVWTVVLSLHSLVLTINSQTTDSYCGNTPADVVFMLDSSNSMWAPHFLQQLEFVSSVAAMFDIGENATQVGLATFNDQVQLQFYLNEHKDKDKLLRAIRLVQQSYGPSTSTDKAIKFLRTHFFNKRYGARDNVPHVAIIITDGQSDHVLRTLIEATKAKRQNIVIFTIGVGSLANKLELERMSSWPPKEYAFIVDNFAFLTSIKEKLAIQTCQVTTPPTTQPPVTTTAPPATTTKTTKTTEVVPTLPLNTETIITTKGITVTSAEETTSLTTPTTITTTTTTTTEATTTQPTTVTIDTTTTTEPIPTTTTWIDIVRRACEKKPIDVVFALDSSDGVGLKDYWYQVKFVRDFTLGLDVGYNKTRVGVVLYSDMVVHGFDVNDHESLSSAIGDLYNIARTYGGTKLDEVIHYVRTKSFRRSVSRKDSAQLLVLITASASDNVHLVKKEANMARKTGINILVVGVGSNINKEELNIIAGVEKYKTNSEADFLSTFLETTTPRRRALFLADSFSTLESVGMEAAIEACTTEISPVPVADQACGTRQEADMMFVMDSVGAGKKNTKKTLDFIKHVTNTMEVSQESIQIGMIQPDDCIPQSESFRLNAHTDKSHVMTALGDNSGDNVYSLIKNMRKNAFKRKEGGRIDAKKIAIVLIDGEIDFPLKALKETRRAQIKGIEVYVILVGSIAPQPEVRDMCDYPPQKHFFQVPDYDGLRDLEDSLIEILCDEL